MSAFEDGGGEDEVVEAVAVEGAALKHDAAAVAVAHAADDDEELDGALADLIAALEDE